MPFFSPAAMLFWARYRNRRPSGRKWGQRWLNSKAPTSSFVTGETSPPAAETR
jgi:hypothetical protein